MRNEELEIINSSFLTPLFRQIEIINDSIRQTDHGDEDAGSPDHLRDPQEDLSRWHDHIRPILFKRILIHALLRGEWQQLLIELTQSSHREALPLAVLLFR